MAIGIVGDAGVRATAQQPKLFVGMILILIFAEALALYGLIVGIILSQKCVCACFFIVLTCPAPRLADARPVSAPTAHALTLCSAGTPRPSLLRARERARRLLGCCEGTYRDSGGGAGDARAAAPHWAQPRVERGA